MEEAKGAEGDEEEEESEEESEDEEGILTLFILTNITLNIDNTTKLI